MRIIPLLCLLSLPCTHALAVTPPCPPAPTISNTTINASIARRIDHVGSMIDRGRRNGWLTPEETRRLTDAQGVWMEQAIAARADGRVSSNEACTLRDLARRIDVVLHQDLNNNEVGEGAAAATSEGAQGIRQAPSGMARLR